MTFLHRMDPFQMSLFGKIGYERPAEICRLIIERYDPTLQTIDSQGPDYYVV